MIPPDIPRISLVVSTLGRTDELRVMLDSVAGQTVAPYEVIIVDQNSDDRLVPLIREFSGSLEINRIHAPDQRGLSRGRNTGWRSSHGEIILFPDDDCWYPGDFLARAIAILEETGADILSGRAANESGQSINGRFEKSAQWINGNNVWTTQIEWVVLFRRQALELVEGYDEAIGIGAATPWQACEGQDITLRAIKAGLRAFYAPTLYAHHAEMDTRFPDAAVIRKGRGYGRGMGRVLRIHDYSSRSAIVWAARPLARASQSILQMNWRRTAYYLEVARGRFMGYFDRP